MTAGKTVTGQYGSFTVLQQVNSSQISSEFLGIHTALCESWNTDSCGCGLKTGGVLGVVKVKSHLVRVKVI